MEGDGIKRACARCRHHKKECKSDCEYTPYFPADQQEKFDKIHKVFGAKNALEKLKELPEDQRAAALESMDYEATARLTDPVHGSHGKIRTLEKRVETHQDVIIALMPYVDAQMFQYIIMALMSPIEVQMLQTQRIAPIGEVQMLQTQRTAPIGEGQMLQSHAGGGPSNCNPSPASLSNIGLP